MAVVAAVSNCCSFLLLVAAVIEERPFRLTTPEGWGGDSVEKLVDTTTNVVSFVKGVEVKRLRLLRDATIP